MPLVQPNLTVALYLNDARTSLFLEDITGLYSAGSNPLGYGVPTVTTNSVTMLTVTLNYTQLSSSLVYVFTLTNSVITAATLSFGGLAAVNILSQFPSTVWPFTSANRLELTKSYVGITLPSFDDMVYSVTYRIQGTYTAIVFDYTASTQELVDTNVACCLSKKLVLVDINDSDSYQKSLVINAYLLTAFNANADLNTTKANQYLNLATALCDDECSCGC